jgi:glycosyltransferase involved in cell wall biosynthesis
MQEELEALIASLGMEGKIRLLGFVDQQDLSHIIPRSITLSPLTGMALIECGLGASPIVAYDRDWQGDFVCDGERGFVVPFGDIDGMAERTLRLLEDPVLAARFGQAIRAHARELADRERIREGEWEAFDRLLGTCVPAEA